MVYEHNCIFLQGNGGTKCIIIKKFVYKIRFERTDELLKLFNFMHFIHLHVFMPSMAGSNGVTEKTML